MKWRGYTEDLRSAKLGSWGSVCTAAILTRSCSLSVISGHSATSEGYPLYPQKQTFVATPIMSALRILAGKLLLWRRRLTGAINRSGGNKNIRSGFAGIWRKGGQRRNGTPVFIGGPHPPLRNKADSNSTSSFHSQRREPCKKLALCTLSQH